MKRILIASAALLAFAGPLSGISYAAPNDHHDDGHHDNNHHDDGHHDAWNASQHNGYTQNGRWHYGSPPANVTNYQPGYHQWRRGDRLPSDFRSRYVVENDWRGHHLRQPPRGYHWVRDDRGQYLLVGIATGLIASLILGSR